MARELVVPHGSILSDSSIAIEELPQAGQGLHDGGTTDRAVLRGNHEGNYENQ